MPRRARLSIAGIPWHIIQRGNNRSACFYREEDYALYLALLEKQALKFSCQIHAYCLMTNHVHLLLTPPEKDSASLMMKHLGQCYVQAINRTYNRSGTLWEGRFKSCIAQEENYVMTCYAYIELNPVRAGMVQDPLDYQWSSYGYNGGGRESSLLTPHSIYLGLADNIEERLAVYRSQCRIALDNGKLTEIRSATNGNFVLGSSNFQEEIARTLRRRTQRGKPGRLRKRAD